MKRKVRQADDERKFPEQNRQGTGTFFEGMDQLLEAIDRPATARSRAKKGKVGVKDKPKRPRESKAEPKPKPLTRSASIESNRSSGSSNRPLLPAPPLESKPKPEPEPKPKPKPPLRAASIESTSDKSDNSESSLDRNMRECMKRDAARGAKTTELIAQEIEAGKPGWSAAFEHEEGPPSPKRARVHINPYDTTTESSGGSSDAPLLRHQMSQ